MLRIRDGPVTNGQKALFLRLIRDPAKSLRFRPRPLIFCRRPRRQTVGKRALFTAFPPCSSKAGVNPFAVDTSSGFAQKIRRPSVYPAVKSLFRRSLLCTYGVAALFGISATAQDIPDLPALTRPTSGPDSAKVFFPPAAPPFGGALGRILPRSGRDRSAEPPDRLGDYVGEFFYPALSTLWSEKDLDRKSAQRLAAFMANRTTLLNELQNKLVAVQTADPTLREAELRAFALTQAPRILAHEKEADQLREKFISPGVLKATVDWSRGREWKIRELPPTMGRWVPSAEFQVLRAAAFYQKGLTPEQRGLLCEIAEESPRGLPGVRSLRREDRPVSTIFFSPEMARIALPAIPAELSSKIYAFIRARDALKDELREAVLANDSSSRAKRDSVFEKLAESQWPQISELAASAEAIRRELAALPPPPPPPLPPQFPAALKARMDAYEADQRLFNQERAAATRIDPTPLVRAARGRQPGVNPATEIRDQIRQKTDKFLGENAERVEELDRRRKSIQAELIQFARAHLDPVTDEPMDVKTLFSRIDTSERYFTQIAREEVLYKDYRAAMLEPGLSPEQRRLLFSAARVALAQALPLGEPFPTGRFPRLVF